MTWSLGRQLCGVERRTWALTHPLATSRTILGGLELLARRTRRVVTSTKTGPGGRRATSHLARSLCLLAGCGAEDTLSSTGPEAGTTLTATASDDMPETSGADGEAESFGQTGAVSTSTSSGSDTGHPPPPGDTGDTEGGVGSSTGDDSETGSPTACAPALPAWSGTVWRVGPPGSQALVYRVDASQRVINRAYRGSSRLEAGVIAADVRGDAAIGGFSDGTILFVRGDDSRCNPGADGQVQTSSGLEDILPFGSDECLVWVSETVPEDMGLSRSRSALTWSPPKWNEVTCGFEHDYLWAVSLDEDVGTVYRYRGASGELESSVTIPELEGAERIGRGTVTSDGDFFFISRDAQSGGPTRLVRVSADASQTEVMLVPEDDLEVAVTVLRSPVDHIWVIGNLGSGIGLYNPVSGTWSTIAQSNPPVTFGDGHIWDGELLVVRRDSAAGPASVVRFDAETGIPEAPLPATFPAPWMPVSVFSDPGGRRWVSGTGRLFEVDGAGAVHEVEPTGTVTTGPSTCTGTEARELAAMVIQ